MHQARWLSSPLAEGKVKLKLKAVLIIVVISISCVNPLFAFSQVSIFNNNKGVYSGSVNGVLFIKRGDTEQTDKLFTILDFQNGKAQLSVIHDVNEIYDTHRENFLGYTTSGKSTVKYSTYYNANGLWVTIGEDTYEISSIDGSCELPVDGIKAIYQTEGDIEYLVISLTKELLLNNYWPKWRQKKSKGETYPSYGAAPKKYARIMPDSFLVFVIKNTK
jgi:hypothetical protein